MNAESRARDAQKKGQATKRPKKNKNTPIEEFVASPLKVKVKVEPEPEANNDIIMEGLDELYKESSIFSQILERHQSRNLVMSVNLDGARMQIHRAQGDLHLTDPDPDRLLQKALRQA